MPLAAYHADIGMSASKCSPCAVCVIAMPSCDDDEERVIISFDLFECLGKRLAYDPVCALLSCFPGKFLPVFNDRNIHTEHFHQGYDRKRHVTCAEYDGFFLISEKLCENILSFDFQDPALMSCCHFSFMLSEKAVLHIAPGDGSVCDERFFTCITASYNSRDQHLVIDIGIAYCLIQIVRLAVMNLTHPDPPP